MPAGIVFGDLHPHNIIVRPDGRIAFVDFELASHAEQPRPTPMGAPGYVPFDGRSGIGADLYALACLHVGLFLPLTALLTHSESKAGELLDALSVRFPVPASFADDLMPVWQARPEAKPASFA